MKSLTLPALLIGLAFPCLSNAAAAPFCVEALSSGALATMEISTKTDLQSRWHRRPSGEEVRAYLPNFGITVGLGRSEMHQVNPDGSVTNIGGLNSGDDYNGWNAIHILRGNWLYIRGAQYDTVLRLERRETRIVVTEAISIRPNDASFLDRALRWAMGMDAKRIAKEGLSAIHRKGKARLYSPTLQTMFFLDEGEKLDLGSFSDLGIGPLRSWAGDVPRAGVAILNTHDRRTYSYNGETLREIETPNLFFGSISQPAPTERTFYWSERRLFELRGESQNELRLVELLPTNGGKDPWPYAIALGSHVVFGSRHALYELVGEKLIPIYQPEPPEHIYGPKDFQRVVDGALVLRTERDDRQTREWLLRPCEAPDSK